MDCRVRSTAADLHGKRGSQSAVWVLQDGSRPDETQLQRVYFVDGEPVTLKFCGPGWEDFDSRPIGTNAAAAVQVLYLTDCELDRAICQVLAIDLA
jgi:hypothetical protein